jgi:hypothetical protein
VPVATVRNHLNVFGPRKLGWRLATGALENVPADTRCDDTARTLGSPDLGSLF